MIFITSENILIALEIILRFAVILGNQKILLFVQFR